jgi:predicted MFS family arabinose efflux permease
VLAASGWVPVRGIYIGSPVLILLAFVSIPRVEGAVASIACFGLAGLACAAFLPLSISFAQKSCAPMVAFVSGAMIAAYQLGYGIGAFGPGLLKAAGGLDLSTIYTAAGGFAALLVALAWFVTQRERTST